MNNSFYGNEYIPNTNYYQPNISNSSYANDFLKNNIGVKGYFFVSFPDAVSWRDKIFYGTISRVGDDYVLIYNEENKEYYLIWNIYINYVTFDEKLLQFTVNF